MHIFTIRDTVGTEAVILPEKGATVISLQKNGTEFLYCDAENLASAERPRCGIPFLFPIFGRLKDWIYTWDETEYSMGIHGFAHTSPWQVTGQTADTLQLILEADEDILAQYPFRFRVILEFSVSDGALTIRQTYENRDEKPMPYNYGFHPYFLTEQLEHFRVEATAETCLDFAEVPTPFGHRELCLTMPEGASETSALLLGVCSPTILHNEVEGKRLTMEFDDSFSRNGLWAPAGKRFLCVEPINGVPNGLNTGNFMTLLPGEQKSAWVRLRPEVF